MNEHLSESKNRSWDFLNNPEHIGHSFLRALAENLIKNKKQPLVYERSMPASEGYCRLLQLLVDTENGIASGKEYSEIVAERTGKQQRLTRDEKEAERHEFQKLIGFLIKDPSGFSVINLVICQAVVHTIMSSLERNESLNTNPFLQGCLMASKDYKKFYLLGVKAGLCSPPKKADSVFEFRKYPITS